MNLSALAGAAGGAAGGGGLSGSSSSSGEQTAKNTNVSPVFNIDFGEIGLALVAIGVLIALAIFFKKR